MYRSNKPFSVSQFLSLVLLSLLLSACASTPDNSSNAPTVPPSAFSRLEHKPDWYLQQLAQADAAYRFTWETLAARSLIAAGDLQQASALSQQLAKEAFTPKQKHEQRIVQAMILQQQGKSGEALAQIADIDLRLATLMKDLDLPQREAHDALNDAVMAALAFIKLRHLRHR